MLPYSFPVSMKKLLTAFALILSLSTLNAQTSLPTAWNFSTPAIASPPAGWTMNLGTNGNLTYGFGIGDAISCRLDATGENFVIQFAQKPGPLSYYLSPQNAGNSWAGQFDIQESVDGTSWNTLRSITYKATTSTNFTGGRYLETPSASARYIRFYYTSKLPGGSAGGGNMAVDSVWLQAAPPPTTPVLQLKQGSTILFTGATAVTGNSATPAFTIENKGTLDSLSIDSVKFSGTAAADYDYSGGAMKIGPGGNSQLQLSFTASAPGSRKAVMTLYSNDPEKNPMVINLYGIGGNYASEPAASPSNLQFTGVTSYGYQTVFTAPASAPEYYLAGKCSNRGANRWHYLQAR